MLVVAITSIPAATVCRPALELPGAIGYGRPSVTFRDFEAAASRSRATLSRHLKELSDSALILHVGYDEYAIPSRETFGQLLVEPEGYARSLLLHHECLGIRREPAWAFACVPVRNALDLDLPYAVPVLRPDERLCGRRGPPYPKALWYDYATSDVAKATLAGSQPGHGGLTVHALKPDLALALLASTLDARVLQAARKASPRLGVSWQEVVKRTRGLFPEKAPLRTLHPNTVVLPDWLEAFWESATRQHARHVLDEAANLPGTVGQEA